MGPMRPWRAVPTCKISSRTRIEPELCEPEPFEPEPTPDRVNHGPHEPENIKKYTYT